MLFYLGVVCILGGIYFLLSNFKIINKNSVSNKPIEAQKVDNFIVRTLSICMCCLGLYLVWPSQKVTASKPVQNSDSPKKVYYWEQSVRDALTKQCLENGKKTAEAYPQLVKDYCSCATDRITEAMSPEDYTQIISKSQEEQAATIRPLVQSCVDILTRLIQLSEESKDDSKTK
ncbi:MAG TPA: hypothetical protein PLS73_08035 [Saprospiraceae bacterium]|nr:hypothetical protein [Saprospiraceae bacterium]